MAAPGWKRDRGITKTNPMKPSRLVQAIVALVLLALAGCVGYVERPRPAVVEIEQDDFVYYPHYEMYYGGRSHRWVYRDGHDWVARPEPRGVEVNILRASPSVHVEFHDSPAGHHAQVSRQYSRRWQPGGEYRR